MEMENRREWRYPLCVFLASVCFSTGGLFIKLIPWSALAINGARNLIGALSMIGVTTLFAIANKLTTAANAIVLQFTAPVFVILFVEVLYKQRTGKADIATCVAVLLGVVLFFVDGIRAGNLWGNVIAILSGVCYAGVIFTPFCFLETDFSFPVIASVIGLGVIQVGLAYILFTIGIRHTPPVTASLLTGLEPILNPLLVAAFYGEKISTLSVIGSIIVVFSIVAYNVYLSKRRNMKTA